MEENPQVIPVPVEIIVPWKPREVWIALAVMLFLSLGFALLVMFFNNSEIVVNLGSFLVELFYLVPVLVILYWKKTTWDTFGLRKFHGGFIQVGCGWLLGVYLVIFLHNSVLAVLNLDTQSLEILRLFSQMESPYWLLLTGIVVAPFVEELFFRGFVYAGLRQQWGWRKAGWVSSLVFAIFHLSPVALVPTFLLGYVFASLYEQSKSIWPGVILHFLVNFFGLIVALVLSNLVSL